MFSKTRERVIKNSALKCSVKGCYNNRANLSSYCRAHRKKLDAYGSPLGNPICKKDYETELKEVEHFLKKNAEHKAVIAAKTVFQQMFEDALLSIGIAAQKELQELHAKGTSVDQCLTTFVAVWLYSCRNPLRLPDDIRLTYAIASEILRPLGKSKLKASVKKTFGTTLREVLGVFAFNAIGAIEREAEKEKKLKIDLRSAI